MIENMRKYTGLMAVVFVLLGAGFLFTMNNGTMARGGKFGSGPTMLEVYGRSLDQQQFRRMGVSTLELATEAGLQGYVNFLMVPTVPEFQMINHRFYGARFGYNYYLYLNRTRQLDNHAITRFVTNRIILQNAMETMGLYADDDAVTDALKTSPRFADASGKFDDTAYATFVEKRLGKLGMTEKDLREIVRENLCLNKLVEIIGSGLIPPRNAVRDRYEAENQTVTLARIVFNRDDFVEKENPTEEEIKTYWEVHQDAYKTEEKRRINYLYLTLPKELEEKKNTPETTGDKKKDTAAKDASDKAKKEAEAKAKADKEEARNKAAKALTLKIDQISSEIYQDANDGKPLDIDAIMAKHGQKMVKSKLFTRATLPKELQELTLRSSSRRGMSLAEAIFSKPFTKDPYDLVSDPLPVGEHGWIIFTLEEVIEPVLLDYAAARNKARAHLIGENASKKVKKAAKEARDAIVELMKSGKSFDAAAKEKGLTPVQVGPFTRNGIPPKNEPSFRKLHVAASAINPGEVSEPIHENDRSLFIYVDKRELEATEDSQRRIDYAIEQSKQELMILTFMNWINHQYAAADVKGAVTKQP